jgi:hypothetical protein
MNATTRLETRPDVLQGVADGLWARHEGGQRLSPAESEALAEACFRLGVRPDADPATALTLLARAHQVDPGNPKHPYHVGLIHLRHGRPAAGLEWLTAAAESAPANHRIWAHVALAHHALHDQSAGTAEANEQQKRAGEITDAVRSGQDTAAPDQTDTPVALVRPGECRWSGINDINAESGLRGPSATERARDTVAPDLALISTLAGGRPGGTAAFAVLAVQWLIHGYAPATVRRLARMLPPGDGPARRMLDLVCELFETDEEWLPDRLAACLAEDRLPDLLVALIHQRRLWWRPLQPPDLGAYTAARQFTGGDQAVHITAMGSALRNLTASRPAAMSDVPPPDSGADTDAGGPDSLLASFERDVVVLSDVRDRALVLARELAKTTPRDAGTYALISADHALLTDVAQRLETTRARHLSTFQDRFKAVPDGLGMSVEEFTERRDRCEKRLQESTGNLRTTLRRKVGRVLDAGRDEFGGADTRPSERAVGIADLFATIAPRQETDPVPPRPEPTTVGAPGGSVAAAVAAVEQALSDNATHAWRTLDAYPADLRRRPALVLLRGYLNGRLAETRHRMGQHTAARRHLQAMLTENPMSPAVSHNLAVAHTAVGDVAAAAQAWHRYVEALYLDAVVAGSPARGAAHRAEVHRVLAGSFGTVAVCGSTCDDDRLRGVPAELTSPARVKLALTHLRLAELNRVLSYGSAVLRIGVTRSVRRARLDEALDARLDLSAIACEPLPARVRASFEELCRAAFQSAYETACEPGGRTRDVTDPAEEEAHAAWARERILWKERIAHALTADDADWPVTESSGEIIASLRLVDGLRLDPQDETLRNAALRHGRQGDPAKYLNRLNDLTDIACGVAVNRIYAAARHTTGKTADFPERYRRIGHSWMRNAVPGSYLALLDDPYAVYSPSVKQAVDLLNANNGRPGEGGRRVVETAVVAMEHWTARLPGATGPATVLAGLLRALDQDAKARRVLIKARNEAFARDAVSLARMSIECDDFDDAVSRLRDEDTDRARQLMIMAYRRWAHSDGPLPPVAQVQQDLSRWNHPENTRMSRTVVVTITINRHGRRPGGADPESLATSLRLLLHEDKENTFARYQLVSLLYHHAHQIRDHMRDAAGAARAALRDELVRLCTECASNAVDLLTTAGDVPPEEHALADDTVRWEVETILGNVKRYLPDGR